MSVDCHGWVLLAVVIVVIIYRQYKTTACSIHLSPIESLATNVSGDDPARVLYFPRRTRGKVVLDPDI